MRNYAVRIVTGALLLCMVAAVAKGDPPSDGQDAQITMEALKMRIRDQERRLGELEAQRDSRQQDIVRREAIREVIKEMNLDAGTRSSLPKWMDNLKFYGDLRLRYQGGCFSGRNKKNRNRARFRLRLGIKKHWLDKQMEVGFRLASGSSSAPTSTNQTFDGHFSQKHVWIDRAYAKYSPNWLKGFTIIGGKMGRPMVHTNLVWDSDVNPEGVWAQYKHKFGSFEPFINAGYFVLDESSSGHDTALANYQVGFNWKVAKSVKWTCAATYYDFDHFDTSYRTANGNNVDAVGDLAAGQFHMINLTNKVGFRALGLPMNVYLDWVHNCGDKDNTADYGNQDNGYAVGLKVGKNKKKGDWSFGYKYAYIEANATPGALNDSDFGGSNRKGHVWGGKYNLTDSLTFGGNLLYTEPIAGSSEDQRDVTVQADLAWKF